MAMDERVKRLIVFFSSGNPVWNEIEDIVTRNDLDLSAAAGPGVEPIEPTVPGEFDAVAGAGQRSPAQRRREGDRKTTLRFERLLGVSATTMANWRRGEGYSSNMADRLRFMSQTLNRVATATGEPRAARAAETVSNYAWALDHQPNLDVYRAAKDLGMSSLQVRLLFDELFYRGKPLLPTLYYDNEEVASRALDSFGKLFLVYIVRDARLLLGTLHVRYAMRAPSVGEGKWFLRAKLHIPMRDATQQEVQNARRRGRSATYFEYDGVVRGTGTRVWWHFEQRVTGDRGQAETDYFTMVTGTRRPAPAMETAQESHCQFWGTYLTTAQDSRPEPVTSEVYLQDVENLDIGDVGAGTLMLGEMDPQEQHELLARHVMWHQPRMLKPFDGSPDASDAVAQRQSELRAARVAYVRHWQQLRAATGK